MNKQRKVLITTTYNEMGIIIDTKAEEVTRPNLQPTCNQLATDTIGRQEAIDLVRDVCDAIMSCCGSHYDEETKDEVYDDIREVDAILKCNKEIRIALKNMPAAQPEPSQIARDIATIIENEQDMRVILKNAQQERMKGRWESQHINIKGDMWIKWSCNCCGYIRSEGWEYTNGGGKPKVFFCENCGADMRGEQDG